MKTISATEFVKRVDWDPSWCLTIKEPTKVEGYLYLKHSNITHLSKHLSFTGIVDLRYCKNLKLATGTYDELVNFSHSGIITIKDLNINKGNEAVFFHCPIQYIPIQYRTKQFIFNKTPLRNSDLKDEEIRKIKSETNNIEL